MPECRSRPCCAFRHGVCGDGPHRRPGRGLRSQSCRPPSPSDSCSPTTIPSTARAWSTRSPSAPSSCFSPRARTGGPRATRSSPSAPTRPARRPDARPRRHRGPRSGARGRLPHAGAVPLGLRGRGARAPGPSAGAAGYLSKDTDRDEIADAIVSAVAGELVVSAALPGALMGHLRREGERRERFGPRERQVMRLTAQGLSGPEIADALGIGPGRSRPTFSASTGSSTSPTAPRWSPRRCAGAWSRDRGAQCHPRRGPGAGPRGGARARRTRPAAARGPGARVLARGGRPAARRARPVRLRGLRRRVAGRRRGGARPVAAGPFAVADVLLLVLLLRRRAERRPTCASPSPSRSSSRRSSPGHVGPRASRRCRLPDSSPRRWRARPSTTRCPRGWSRCTPST